MRSFPRCLVVATAMVGVSVAPRIAVASAAAHLTAERISSGDAPFAVYPAGLAPEGGPAPTALVVMMPVVGRLVGSGNLLYTTSLDVSNLSASSVKVDYVFHGNDIKTGAAITVGGNLINDGGTKMRSFSVVHLDDAIDTLRQLGKITAVEEADGIIGSAIFSFEGVTASGQGAVRARFFSSQFGGTVGVAINGHEFTTTETTAVAAAFSDTQSLANTPQLYSNIFLTNFGKWNPSTGQFFASTDQVTLTAFSNATGARIGTPLTVTIASGQTLSTGLSALGVPPGSGQVIVLAKATSGEGFLLGVGAGIDAVTKDPSGFAMSNVPPSATGPVQTGGGGDLAPQLAGSWTGTWSNTTFQTLGSAALTIAVNSTAKTFSATLTLGGNVFGGTAPPPQIYSGAYTGTGVSYSGHSSAFGDIVFTISPAGAINGSLSNIPSANVSKVTFTGTATAHTITINYPITLRPSGTAVGVVMLTKP